jgi:hypothetical protein
MMGTPLGQVPAGLIKAQVLGTQYGELVSLIGP